MIRQRCSDAKIDVRRGLHHLRQGYLLVLDDNDDPAAIFRMLTWIYALNYDGEPTVAAINNSESAISAAKK